MPENANPPDSRFERDRRFARTDIEAIQNSSARIDEKKIDGLLGVAGDFKVDEDVIGSDATKRFPKEKWGYQGTSYETIRAIVRAVSPQSGQTVYDLGSGQGRFVLYGALASSAKFVGIELLQERVDACNKSKTRLGIDNVEFRSGNIIDHDVSDGDVFYLFNPFTPATTLRVIANLRRIAETKNITIVCTGNIQLLFAQEPWLDHPQTVHSPEPIHIFKSRIFKSRILAGRK